MGRPFYILLISCLISKLLSLSCQAESSENEIGNISLEDLLNIEITTASRSKESAQKAPGTLIVIPKSIIKDRGYRHLEDILSDLPGVDLQRNSDASVYNRVSVRGITNNNKFVILQNGMRISSPTGEEIPIHYNFPLYNIKQVEIVYGPASALYGADAFTGVINLITSQTMDSQKASTSIQRGSHGHQYIDFYANSTIGESGILSVGGHMEKSNHENLSNTYPSLFEQVDLVTFGGSTVMNGSDRVLGQYPTSSESFYAQLELAESFKFSFNRSVFQHPTASGDKSFIVNFNENAHWQTELTHLAGTHTYKANEFLQIDTQLSYNLYEIDSSSKFSNIYVDFQNGYKYASGSEFEFGQQYFYTPTENWNWIFGFSLEEFTSQPKSADLESPYDESLSTNGQDYTYIGTDLPLQLYNIAYTNYAVFSQLKYNFASNLTGVFGLRYDDSSFYGSTTNPRLGLVYSTSESTTWKLLYGEAFLAPSPMRTYEHYGSFAFQNNDGIYQSFFFHIPNTSLKPEEMKTLELNGNFLVTENLNFNFTIFKEEASNLIGQVFTSPPESNYISGGNILETQTNDNIGQLDATGVDVSFMYQTQIVDAQLNLWGNISWLNGQLKTPDGTVGLPFSSDKKVKLGFTYRSNNWFITPNIHVIGKMRGSETGDDIGKTVKNYHIVNIYSGIEQVFSSANLNFRITNLLDKKYYNAGLGGLAMLETPQETRSLDLLLSWQF